MLNIREQLDYIFLGMDTKPVDPQPIRLSEEIKSAIPPDDLQRKFSVRVDEEIE